MRRHFTCHGETHQVEERHEAPVGHDDRLLRGPAPPSDWVLHFWDVHHAVIGSIPNRTGLRMDELTDDELCLHMAEARRIQTPESFEDGEPRNRTV